MESRLPDISLSERSDLPGPLNWVGMQHVDLPVTLAEPGYRRTLSARADMQVDLPAAHVKGIHMSRLYRLVDALGDDAPLTPARLRDTLQAMIDSHRDCATGNARLRLAFDLLARRPALVTAGLAGWKAYPVRLDASLVDGAFRLDARVSVGYASTCPCSAALSRQAVEQGFREAFAEPGAAPLSVEAVAAWLRAHATLATPHSQRSEARVEVGLAAEAPALKLLDLIERVEAAVGTPLQTAVKRADEQAFALLNGRNLMFVEDAARRIRHALAAEFTRVRVHVRHLESLHPHDASAWADDAGMPR
ncbi:GTP cyclohydrolase FolE2 [Burkholderia perseverans]|uniref:GTP cyclohydrolase FolE2 n=1 Tax=Burkholderia perseverans TaxID=2615214 RepID=UPI001FEF1322|nr:GTP cyclohydrolase FolE2 [Burkholderia perseverans]